MNCREWLYELPLASASGQINQRAKALAEFYLLNFPFGFSRISAKAIRMIDFLI
jgi:hypothetical protein